GRLARDELHDRHRLARGRRARGRALRGAGARSRSRILGPRAERGHPRCRRGGVCRRDAPCAARSAARRLTAFSKRSIPVAITQNRIQGLAAAVVAKKPRPRRMRLSSVANAIRLTKAFSEHEYEMGISALAQRLGLAKSTVHRLATTLVEYDILEQNRETGKYRLGLALFELGTLVRRKMDAVSESRQQMSALLEMTGETVQLAVLDHQSVLYIRILESRQQVRMSSTVGARAPAHCTSVGKALLAFQSPELVKQILENGLRRFTANTIVDPAALQEELASIRAKGYAID